MMEEDSKMESMKNSYMDQVEAQQQQVERALKVNRKSKNSPISDRAMVQQQAVPYPDIQSPEEDTSVIRKAGGGGGGGGSGGMQDTSTLSQAPEVRVTGWFHWKTVVVPPNAYVIHTRKGHKEPLHIGMGISFSFNPNIDSFLVVPSAMQTILINAHCICKDLQGLLVQAYVQWIIDDFAIAYKKLDFTDAVDPMRIVNIQLREQAEAAIKDKVSTMEIDDVLSDKQPIIEELTARLRQVAEGQKGKQEGLGLRIVTVQIKEAVVSSTRLWENLQKPFRAEREKKAKLAQLDAESSVQTQELYHSKIRQTEQLNTESELAKLRASQESERFEREQSEKIRRFQKEQEVNRQSIQERSVSEKQSELARMELERIRLQNELEMNKARQESKHQEILKEIELKIAAVSKQVEELEARFKLEKLEVERNGELVHLQQESEVQNREALYKAKLALLEAKNQVNNRQSTTELEFESVRQKINNEVSVNHLQAKLMAELPNIASHLPHPQELKTIAIGTSNPEVQSLMSLVTQLMSFVEIFRKNPASNDVAGNSA